jgi:hypothetical protein
MGVVDVIELLNTMVAEGIIANYAVGGAVGATFYVEPVATVDVDVFVELPSSSGSSLVNPSPIFAFLRSRGHMMEGEYVRIGDWPVQFIGPPGPLGEEALREAATVDVEGKPVRVFSAEHLAALALAAGRAKDRARVLQFIEEGALDAKRFEEIVLRHGLSSAWSTFNREFDTKR